MFTTKSKVERAEDAKKWLHTLSVKARSLVEEGVDSTRMYVKGDYCYERVTYPFSDTAIYLLNTDTVSALFQAQSIAGKSGVLNFASYKHPGGGFLKGSMAQEEALCHCSTLYPALDSKRWVFYEPHTVFSNGGLYDDEFLSTEDVYFFKGQSISSSMCKATVVTAAATNFKAANNKDAAKTSMLKRMQYVYHLFNYLDCDTIVLGAWGCGVFGHDTSFVAKAWRDVINSELFSIANVIFAVPGTSHYDKFKEVFKDAKTSIK